MSWNMDASKRAYEVHALIRTCICADDTRFNADEVFGGENGSGNGVSWTLQIAERLMNELIDMIEKMEMDRHKAEKEAA